MDAIFGEDLVRARSSPSMAVRVLANSVVAGKTVFELFLRLVGPVFVGLAISLILTVIYICAVTVVPMNWPWLSFASALHLPVDIFLIFNIFFNYYMVITTSPGEAPDPVGVDNDALEALRKEPRPQRGEGFSKYCKECKKPKPARAHHCSVCGKCVRKMDHHCPWVCNCVGHGNHRYFYLFMFWLLLGCLFVVLLAFRPFLQASNYRVVWTAATGRGSVIFVFVLCLAVSAALAMMLAWHTYLIVSAQTTIEFYFNKMRERQAMDRGESYHNPYDLGMRRNWREFFGGGRYWWSWAMPSTEIPGDGVTYPTRDDLVRSDVQLV